MFIRDAPAALGSRTLLVGASRSQYVREDLHEHRATTPYVYATEDDVPEYFDGVDFGDDGDGGSSLGRRPGSGGVV